MPSILAPAKINLTLEILGKRPDGYHDIRTIIVPIGVFDTVGIEEGGVEDAVEVVGADVPIDKIGPSGDNLCLKAARLFRSAVADRAAVPPLRVSLYKRIPIGGGLGGGSADAAAVLGLLNKMHGGALAEAELVALAAKIGSDVPALVLGGAVLIEGMGEKVTKIENMPPAHIVLVNPGVHVSTAEAYKNASGVLTSPEISSIIMYSPPRVNGHLAADARLFNGLESSVFASNPGVARAAQMLRDAGACTVLMSGSGASVFALASSSVEAENLRRAMPVEFWSKATQTMPDGVMAAHGPLEA